MKNKGLKVTLVIGIIILLSILSFGGLYQKGIYQYEDQIPSYLLGDGVTGHRSIVLKPQDVVETETGTESENTENAGEEATSEETTETDTNANGTEEQTDNTQEMMTEENFEKAKEIIRKRLNEISTESYYTIKLDKTTGKIHINVLDSTYTDTISSVIVERGVFQIVDAETEEVLIDNARVKDANVQYTSGSLGGMLAFLNIEFDQEGAEKLREISKTYVETTDEEGNSVEKNVIIRIDENDLIETTFSEEITTGSLQLTVGQETTDTSELQDYLTQASNFAVIIDKEPLPLIYEVDENVYTSLSITNAQIQKMLIAAGVIAAILAIYLIYRYHKNGILAILTLVGILATLLIVIRYTNVILTAEAIGAILVTMILGYLSMMIVLKDQQKGEEEVEIKKKLKEGMFTTAKVLLPVLILSIVLCFMGWLPIYSFAMTLFWGILVIMLFIATVLRTLVLGTRK